MFSRGIKIDIVLTLSHTVPVCVHIFSICAQVFRVKKDTINHHDIRVRACRKTMLSVGIRGIAGSARMLSRHARNTRF